MRKRKTVRKHLQPILRSCEIVLAVLGALLCPFCLFLGLGAILLRMRSTGGGAWPGVGALFVFDSLLLWYTANVFWRGVGSAVKNARGEGRYVVGAGVVSIVLALVHAVLFLKGKMPYALPIALFAANALLLLRPTEE